MIELTTGVVFLMSSLYGAGHTNATNADGSKNVTTREEGATVTTMSTSTISKNEGVEAYIRKEFADTPILIEIAYCESRFHQFGEDGTVVRGIANKQDVGIMQINEKYHAEDAIAKGFDIYTTEGNVAFGKYLYDKYGTSPWKYSSKCWAGDLAIK